MINSDQIPNSRKLLTLLGFNPQKQGVVSRLFPPSPRFGNLRTLQPCLPPCFPHYLLVCPPLCLLLCLAPLLPSFSNLSVTLSPNFVSQLCLSLCLKLCLPNMDLVENLLTAHLELGILTAGLQSWVNRTTVDSCIPKSILGCFGEPVDLSTQCKCIWYTHVYIYIYTYMFISTIYTYLYLTTLFPSIFDITWVDLTTTFSLLVEFARHAMCLTASQREVAVGETAQTLEPVQIGCT